MERVGHLLAALFVVVVLFTGCTLLRRERPPVVVVVVVLDQSPSTDISRRCAELRARARSLLLPGHPRIELAAIGTGQASGEQLVEWRRYSMTYRLYQAPDDAQKNAEAWLDDITERCNARLHATDTSPIYATVVEAVASIKSHCQAIEAHGERCASRELIMFSDLVENREPAISAHLHASLHRRRRAGAALPPLPKIDTSELTSVSVAGLANSNDSRAPSPDVVMAVWSEVLGATVTFDATAAADERTPVQR